MEKIPTVGSCPVCNIEENGKSRDHDGPLDRESLAGITNHGIHDSASEPLGKDDGFSFQGSISPVSVDDNSQW
jgi:hypothetical protein